MLKRQVEKAKHYLPLQQGYKKILNKKCESRNDHRKRHVSGQNRRVGICAEFSFSSVTYWIVTFQKISTKVSMVYTHKKKWDHGRTYIKRFHFAQLNWFSLKVKNACIVSLIFKTALSSIKKCCWLLSDTKQQPATVMTFLHHSKFIKFINLCVT